MRIAVDVRSMMDRPTGIGTYTAQLVRHCVERMREHGDEVVLFSFGGARPAAALQELAHMPRVRFVHHPVPMRIVRQAWRRLRAPSLERLLGPLDVVIAAETTMPVCDAPVVAVAHDALWAEHPEWFNRYAKRAGAENLADAAARAAVVVAVSERTARSVRQLHPAVAGRLMLVSPATAASNAEAVVELDARDDVTVLFVGTLEPRKGVGVIAQALLEARGAARRARLVVCGQRGWGKPEGMHALAELEKSGRCERLGYADSATVERLRARCAVAAVPSLDEGFGLPLLEAMHAGAPTIASDIAVFHEVGGDAFARARAGDAASFSAVLDELFEAPTRRRALSEAGRVRAAQFSSERQRAQLDAAIARALAARATSSEA